MTVFLSRKRQVCGVTVDLGSSHLGCILVCSNQHTQMINEAVKNNSKANQHYNTKKRLYVHFVDTNNVVTKVESYI